MNNDSDFLKKYSYLTYVYIVSELEQYNKRITERYDQITPELYTLKDKGKINFNSPATWIYYTKNISRSMGQFILVS